MNTLFTFINENLKSNDSLLAIIDKIPIYINDEVKTYCKTKEYFTTKKYNRIKLCDYSNDIFEIVLICWDDSSESRIHDHPENGCILHLMDGNLEEFLYNKEIKLEKKSVYSSGSTSYMNNLKGYHKIKCNKKALSLHIYSPPNHKTMIISE